MEYACVSVVYELLEIDWAALQVKSDGIDVGKQRGPEFAKEETIDLVANLSRQVAKAETFGHIRRHVAAGMLCLAGPGSDWYSILTAISCRLLSHKVAGERVSGANEHASSESEPR